MTARTQGALEAARGFAESVRQEVKASLPFSGAYLSPLSEYLLLPYDGAHLRQHPEAAPTRIGTSRHFLYQHHLNNPSGKRPASTSFRDVVAFERDAQRHTTSNGIIFLCGQPSPNWLNALGAHYNIDPDFLQQHMTYIPSAQRDTFFNPKSTYTGRHTIRMCIPTILHVGSDYRRISQEDLFNAKVQAKTIIQGHHKATKLAPHRDSGSPVIRALNIHRADLISIDQYISITLLRNGPRWTVVAWTDANCGGEVSPLPQQLAHGCLRLSKGQTVFCPIQLGRKSPLWASTPAGPHIQSRSTPIQTLSVLPESYGLSLNAQIAAQDPFYAILPVFDFTASALSQYLNMLEMLIDQLLDDQLIFPTPANTALLPNSAGFQENKLILHRHMCLIEDAITTLRSSGGQFWEGKGPTTDDSLSVTASLVTQYESLRSQAQSLLVKCEQGVDLLRYSITRQDTRVANEQARSVAALTKLTTRFTILYAPVSFITSIFGMNVSPFQGNTSIGWWFICAVPVVIMSFLLSSQHSWLAALLRKGRMAIANWSGRRRTDYNALPMDAV